MAKLKIQFITSANPAEAVEWLIDNADMHVDESQLKKSVNRLKTIESLLKSNGEALYVGVDTMNATILEESSVLSLSNV